MNKQKDSNINFSKRSLGRLTACQALCIYFNEIIDNKKIDSILFDINKNFIEKEFSSLETDFKDVYSSEFVRKLIIGVIENKEEFDKIIKDNLNKKETLETMDEIARYSLSLAIYELKFSANTAKEVIINEYVDIVADFLSEKEVKFINGILDNIALEIRGGKKKEIKESKTSENMSPNKNARTGRKILKLKNS